MPTAMAQKMTTRARIEGRMTTSTSPARKNPATRPLKEPPVSLRHCKASRLASPVFSMPSPMMTAAKLSHGSTVAHGPNTTSASATPQRI